MKNPPKSFTFHIAFKNRVAMPKYRLAAIEKTKCVMNIQGNIAFGGRGGICTPHPTRIPGDFLCSLFSTTIIEHWNGVMKSLFKELMVPL